MFEKPEVGTVVAVTTDWTDAYALYVGHVRCWRNIQRDVGEVLPSRDFDDPATFCMATGRPEFPVAVIPLRRVIDLRLSDGTEAAETKEEPKKEESEVWTVEGSKGNEYTVTRKGEQWSCTCPGFGFRGQCKHVNAKKQEVLDRNS